MDNTAKARDRQHQHNHRRHGWHEPLEEPYELTKADLDLLHSPMARHGWRLITICENYFAICSCGWRSAETDYLVLMLRQVTDHLGAAEQERGGRPSPAPTPAPGKRDTNRREAVGRARELGASAQSRQSRLPQALERSSDLLSRSGERLGHREVMLRRAQMDTWVNAPSPVTGTSTVLADRSNHLLARLWRLIGYGGRRCYSCRTSLVTHRILASGKYVCDKCGK
jgi:hypothetical protein